MLVLALVLVMSLSVPAFAAETGVGVGSYSADVNGTYVPGTVGNETVFCVDITWTDLNFTYHAAKEPVWDPVEHKYSERVNAYWEGEGTITVTNHSNAIISATPAFVADSGYESVEMVFSESALNISSAEFMPFGENQVGTVTVTPAGKLPADTDGKIGAITIEIAESTTPNLADAQALVNQARTLDIEIGNYRRTMPEGEERTILGSESGILVTNFNTLEVEMEDVYAATPSGLEEAYVRTRTQYYKVMALYNAIKAGE
jgi:hypothetical protein